MDAVLSTYQRTRCLVPTGLIEGSVLAPRRVLLVDDHEFIRVGVRSAYAQIDGIEVEWVEAGSLTEAIRLYGSDSHFDVVLLDLNLVDCKGLQGLRQFLRVYPQARIAVFSATHDEFVVRQARALGAVAYVSKTAGVVDLRNALRSLLLSRDAPGLALRSGLAGNPLFPHCNGSSIYDRVAELGPRHLEILELVLSGCTNQEISHAIHLSLGTVKNYVSSLLLALDVKSRSHLISLFR
ncbi:MAG: response regulator [Leptothrix sp. (in: b-proteobacteria)]